LGELIYSNAFNPFEARKPSIDGKDIVRGGIGVSNVTHLGPGRHVIVNARLQRNEGPSHESLQNICGENGEESEVPSNSGNIHLTDQLMKVSDLD